MSRPGRLVRAAPYSVKEIYYTLQGEGVNTGRAAVFCRFSGCNLWDGRPESKGRARCRFCDTDFVGIDGPGGGTFETPEGLAQAVAQAWGGGWHGLARPLVVCTGGEPLLQLDSAATSAMARLGFEVAVETNGTRPLPAGVSWVCLSPKAGTRLAIDSAHETKVVFPQPGLDLSYFEHPRFGRLWLSPMDGPDRLANTEAAIHYCLCHPQWSLNVQTHKYLGIP